MRTANGLRAQVTTGIVVAIVGTANACAMGLYHGLGAFVVGMAITAVAVRAIAIDEADIANAMRGKK